MIAQVLVNGLLLGGMLGLIGLGFSMVWGILNIVNLAHAAFIMMGAYLTFYFFNQLGVDPFLTLPISMLALFVLGFVLQKYIINLVIRAPLLVTFVLTFGFETFFVSLARVFFTGDQRAVSPTYNAAALVIGDTIINWMKLGALAIALLLTGGLFLFMRYTRTGNAIRAVGMDADAARLMGVNVAQIYAITYALSAAVAGAAGTLLSMWYSFTPDSFGIYNIRAFAVVVLGGLGSIPGALIGGLAFGLLDQLIASGNVAGVQLGALKEALIFMALVVILVVRPTGLLGKVGYS
jgi:branched-chain amino acid transport system permease protein